MEQVFLEHPELAHEIIVFILKAFIWILGIIGVFIIILFTIIGFFARNKLSNIEATFVSLNKNIQELFQELRKINQKVGTYDQIVIEHNKHWGKSKCGGHTDNSQAE